MNETEAQYETSKEAYPYKDRPLDKRIARVLIPQLYTTGNYYKVAEIKDGLIQYHVERGGKPPEISSLHTVIYKILRAFEKEGLAKRDDKIDDLWMLISNADEVSQPNDEMNITVELKRRDDRIEQLEKALLTVLSLQIGNYVCSSDEFLNKVHIFATERVTTLIEDYDSSEKVVEKMLEIGQEALKNNKF